MKYIIASICFFVGIIGFFSIVLYIRSRFTRSYEKKFQEAYEADENNQTDKAIEKYQAVIEGAKDDNPILINTYLLLAEAFHEKGNNYDNDAIKAIDSAISLVKNDKINHEKTYIKQALFYKADFLSQIGHYQDAKALFEEIRKLFPDDKIMLSKTDKSLKQLIGLESSVVK